LSLSDQTIVMGRPLYKVTSNRCHGANKLGETAMGSQVQIYPTKGPIWLWCWKGFLYKITANNAPIIDERSYVYSIFTINYK